MLTEVKHIIKGYYPIAIILLAKGRVSCSDESIKELIEFDMYPAVKQCLMQQKKYSLFYSFAAAVGNIDDMKLLYSTGKKPTASALKYAARYYAKTGNSEIFDWLIENKCPSDDSVTPEIARYGNVKMMKRMIDMKMKLGESTFYNAVVSNNVEMLAYLNGISDFMQSKYADFALSHGCVDIIRWMIDEDMIKNTYYSPRVCMTFEGAKLLYENKFHLQNHLIIDILDSSYESRPWVISKIKSGYFTLNAKLLTRSVFIISYETFVFLLENKCPFEPSVYIKAISFDRLEIIQYLYANDYPLPEDIEMYKHAAYIGNIRILNWLYKNDFKYDETVFIAAVSNNKRRYTKVLNWLAERKFPYPANIMSIAKSKGHSGTVKWLQRRFK